MNQADVLGLAKFVHLFLFSKAAPAGSVLSVVHSANTQEKGVSAYNFHTTRLQRYVACVENRLEGCKGSAKLPTPVKRRVHGL
eukprot:1139471-Pelagomonas_calceolata.AAC.1